VENRERTKRIIHVTVIGAGYIGLPTAALLASKGYSVTANDSNREVVDQINLGVSPNNEKGLQELLDIGHASGSLVARSDVPSSDIFLITVPTPITELFEPDLQHIFDAIDSIIDKLEFGNIVIVESTVPVNTTLRIAKIIEERRPELFDSNNLGVSPIKIAHCPERVLPGNLIEELLNNDRIIGGINEESTKAAANFYRSFVKGNIFTTDSRTAELSKLAENTFRDINIGFANELSEICDELSVDVWELIALTNRHPRVQILDPGPGVGGHCIAVDPWFIVKSSPKTSKMIQMARQVNIEKENFVVSKILDSLKYFNFKNLVLYGLTYKKNVGDFRNSPSLSILNNLAQIPALNIEVSDPFFEVKKHAHLIPSSVSVIGEESDPKDNRLHVLLVAHDVFSHLNLTNYPDLAIINFCRKTV